MNINELKPRATGLEQLQAMLASGKGAPIGETLKFTLAEVTEGHVVFEAIPGLHVYNPIGSVHGGYIAALLDSACGCAVHSLLNADQIHTTLELKTAYHRPVTTETGTIRAIGSVINMGRRVAYAEGRLVDANDRLLASATSTLLIMERPA